MDKHDSGITRRRVAAGHRCARRRFGRLHARMAQSGAGSSWHVGRRLLKLLAKNIDTPLMVPKKYERARYGGDSERRAKMRAEARLPRGTSDPRD
jgi:hypothetical protein